MLCERCTRRGGVGPLVGQTLDLTVKLDLTRPTSHRRSAHQICRTILTGSQDSYSGFRFCSAGLQACRAVVLLYRIAPWPSWFISCLRSTGDCRPKGLHYLQMKSALGVRGVSLTRH